MCTDAVMPSRVRDQLKNVQQDQLKTVQLGNDRSIDVRIRANSSLPALLAFGFL